VRSALKSLAWVKDVKVFLDSKQAVVTADKSRYDEKAMLKVLKDSGYPSKVVK
jgi:copper chaperone CopZ